MSATSPFAQWLKQRRRKLDLTQEALAERLNCSVVTISKIEMGQRRPSKQIAELLAEELRVPEQTRDAFLRFARGLADTLPAPTTLPTPLTPLLGREHELTHMAHVLNDAGGRLLTLTGPGGVGKTRLALQAAHALSATRADDAAFVSLAGVSRSSDVPSALATALGLTLQGADDVVPQLIAYLRPRHCLLVLDNLEHVLADGETARLVTQLLAGAPSVQLIATSREPLRVPGEWDLRVHGLPLPPDVPPSPATVAGSATQLFVQAAQRADARFKPNAEDIGAIARICRLVDGVPLAIELAAAWVDALRPGEIADEIARTLDFLATSSVAIDERQRSIRAVFEQSWRLLGADEQRALGALSAFRGGFTRGSAAGVAAVSLSQLAALLGKSLIRRDVNGRYDLHELVRQFTAEKLAEDAAAERAAHAAHVHFFLTLLNAAEPKLRSAEQDAMLSRLMGDVDNLRVAWDRAVALGWLDEINTAMRGLARLYAIKSWNEEGVQRFGAAAALRDDASTAHLLTYQSWFYARLEEMELSLRVLEEAFARIEGSSDPGFRIEPHLFRALTLYKAERYGEAAAAMRIVRTMAQQINNRWFEGIAVHALAYGAFLHAGETEYSFAEVLRAAGMLRDEGDVFQAVVLMQSAAHIAIVAGRYDDAERLLADAGDVTERLGNAYDMGGIALMRGQLALAHGDRDRARQHLERSVTLFQQAHASRQAADAIALLDVLSASSANT